MQTDIREGDEHFTHSVRCKNCGWVGFTGDLMAGMKPKLYCPKCESMEIENVKTVVA